MAAQNAASRRTGFAMESHAPSNPPPLSLQDKLDCITHERKVLEILRELMRHGLHDGDDVQHRADGSHGRLVVLHAGVEPQPVVELDDGTQIAFRAADWGRSPL
jgi:hypothetical protein